MAVPTYPSPIDALLRLGDCQGVEAQQWPNYVQELGLTIHHIPALIQLAQDEQWWAFFGDNLIAKTNF
jgi:hypothetical protein